MSGLDQQLEQESQWEYPQRRVARLNVFTGNQANLPTHDFDILGFGTDSNGGVGRALTGMLAPTHLAYHYTSIAREADGWPSSVVPETGIGRLISCYNWWINPVVFSNQDPNSDAANRFSIPGGTITLTAGLWIHFWYDPFSTRWRQIGN